MPITRIFWARGRDKDIHVVHGQSSPDLTTTFLIFEELKPDGTTSNEWAEDYLNNNNDVDLKFIPRFKGTQAGDDFTGHGITVDTTTGEVTVAAALPSPRKANFILEVEASERASGDVIDTEFIRIHVHQSISQLWLTPDTLTVRPTSAVRPDVPGSRFSVRAQFDDGVVGDITGMAGITWTPAGNVSGTGLLIIAAGNNTGDTIAITATLSAALGGASATANMRIADAWDPAHPIDASIVVGGGWPGTINPEKVPNVLFLGDGFVAADRAKFDQYINSIVHFLKINPLNRPYDVLSTSMNFWSAFLPSDGRGVTVDGEVYPVGSGASMKARFVRGPKKPPADHAGVWDLEHLLYMVGLPVRNDDPSNAARTNAIIKDEWKQLVDPDPTPKVNNALINRWRRLAKRALIDHHDSALGVTCGQPVSDPSDVKDINLHPNRMTRNRLDHLLRALRDPRGIPIQDLWATKADGTRPNDYDLICLVVVGSGRALNSDGYFISDVLDDIKIAPIAGKNAFTLRYEAADIPNAADSERGRVLAHELTHSFGIGDEYGERKGPPVFTSAFIDGRYGNLTLEADTKRAGKFHGDEVKWNWHRIYKAAELAQAPVDAGGGTFRLALVLSQGFQFAVGDTVHLRFRKYPQPLIKLPKLSIPLEITDPAPTSDTIHVKAKAGAVWAYPNTINPPQFAAEFLPGSIVYIPTPAPASVRSAAYPYAEMIAKQIKEYITTNDKPLTVYPSVVDDNDVQPPVIPGVSLPDCFSKHRPRIVGLYSGGKGYHLGVFHPTGNCIMRDSHTDGREFCPVCRYLLVDYIDPYHHWWIDRDYAKIYPLK